MNNQGRLSTQIAAQANVSPEDAQLAVYCLNLARSGKTIEEAAALARRRRDEIRDVARDWGFEFVDYRPAPPLLLTWEKVKRGEWALKGPAGEIVGTLNSDGEGSYSAGLDARTRADGSKPIVAARRISQQLDQTCHERLGRDDIAVRFVNPDGSFEHLAPEIAVNAPAMRAALAA